MPPIKFRPANNRPDRDASLKGSHPKLEFLLLFVPVALLAFVAVSMITSYVQKWLWMKQLDYTGIFWTVFSVQWLMFVAALICVYFFFWVNLLKAIHNSTPSGTGDGAQKISSFRQHMRERTNIDFSPKMLDGYVVIVSAWMAWLAATFFSEAWDTLLRFRYGGSFHLKDPLFGIDTGFYVFSLPFYQMIQTAVVLLTLAVIAMTACIYAYFKLLRMDGAGDLAADRKAISHLSLLGCILMAAFFAGFLLDHYELVYSTQGVVYGAGFTAVHVTQYALWVMAALSVAGCAFLASNAHRPRVRFLAAGAVTYVAVYVAGVMAIPAIFQKLVVQPSELAFETPYLQRYIAYTREAYDLGGVQETSYPALTDLTPAVLMRNQSTIDNIRLWDERPLLQMYQQTQSIRLYYKFNNVGVDRYHLKDGYHQVMLATRELSPSLPEAAQTWVNEKLEFTHGYGVVMNYVSKKVGGGFPQYLIDNVPPETTDGINISEPAVYYGQSQRGYRIVGTGTKEFDYPKGNDNVYTSYKGSGGIPIDSIWKRLLFAWTQGDVNILFTSYLQPESKIQIWRDVQTRVATVAPFLRLDHDPYPVLSGGKLYWIQDAYTSSNQFPYAAPHGLGFGDDLNYIRNSVKAVVNMYDGTVDFYAMDPADPILAAYSRAFPGVFKDLAQLSPDLKSHLRYPEDLFAIQADEYKTFHMTNPQVFYNREDLWVAPTETYGGAQGPMQPYYILMKLPGSDKLEYLLMTPFTPQNRGNMISWMAARCDFPDYGKKLFYELPKEKLTYGPDQIEAMINQDPNISQQLTLWDQTGSHVIRGKLIVTPIENSFLYVVPLYLQAEGENFPQLKRVVAVSGDHVVMEPTLDEAIADLFTPQQPIGIFSGKSSSQQPLAQPAPDIAPAPK